jgi:hypothetical protein
MTRTVHTVRFADARSLVHAPGETVDLVVTSPPYPMIAMWDAAFTSLDASIALRSRRRTGKLRLKRCTRCSMRSGAGASRRSAPAGSPASTSATRRAAWAGNSASGRTMHASFWAQPRSAFHALPDILWRKPTNAPNKFLGSGMLPAGAYVTYEHEYVLVLRKGRKREFCSREAKLERAKSAFFWEERNAWFSDVWLDLRGEQQSLDDAESRGRSGAFPRELAYRLVNMFSVRGRCRARPVPRHGHNSHGGRQPRDVRAWATRSIAASSRWCAATQELPSSSAAGAPRSASRRMELSCASELPPASRSSDGTRVSECPS